MMIHYGPLKECCLKVLCLVIELSCGIILQDITTFLYSGMFSGHPSMQIVYWTGEVLFCLLLCVCVCWGGWCGDVVVVLVYTPTGASTLMPLLFFLIKLTNQYHFQKQNVRYLLYKELHLLTKMKD